MKVQTVNRKILPLFAILARNSFHLSWIGLLFAGPESYTRTVGSRPRGDLEFKLALDSVDRSLDRSMAREPSSPLEVAEYPGLFCPSGYYVEDRDSGYDGGSPLKGGSLLGTGSYYPYSNRVYTS